MTELEQELNRKWPLAGCTEPDKSTLEMFRRHFSEGVAWQAKKDEEIINGFFSREAVEELLNAASRYMGHHHYKHDPQLMEWFNINYPPKPE